MILEITLSVILVGVVLHSIVFVFMLNAGLLPRPDPGERAEKLLLRMP